MESFGETLKKERVARRTTLREIKEHVKKSISYLSDIERGRKGPPNLETVRKIEESLGIDDGRLVNIALKLRKKVPKNVTQRIKMRPRLSELLLRADNLTDEQIEEVIEEIERRRDR